MRVGFLMPIIGNLDMLHRRGTRDEREQRLIDGALQSADRAKTLVQRLLTFAHRQPLQLLDVDVGSLVTGMVDLIAILPARISSSSLTSHQNCLWPRQIPTTWRWRSSISL